MSETKKTAGDDARAVRRQKALLLRVEGRKTIREIAAECGVSVQTAHNDVRLMVEQEIEGQEKVIETAKAIEVERLDLWLTTVMNRLEGLKDPEDIQKMLNLALKISEQRSKLLGLYAATKQQVDATVISAAEATPARAREIMQSQFSSNATPDKLAQADANDSEPDDDSAD